MKDKLEAFEVLDPGILTTIQDFGRFGYTEFGVPYSGALDSFSYRIANILVNNPENEACLETMIMGLKLKSLGEFLIAITGADLTPLINNEPVKMWKPYLIKKGDIITFKRVRFGCRAYVSVSGGLAVPKVMGSYSTYLSGKFGGLEGRPLKKGDILYRFDLPFPLDILNIKFPEELIPRFNRELILRIILGPQCDHFTEEGLKTFFSSIYEVTSQSDRMGIRLKGPFIERRQDVEESIISEGLLPGAIQVPGNGNPIIILNELVTGGYTKIASVISTDLLKVAQLKPGDSVRFMPVSIEEAHTLLKEQEDQINNFKKKLIGIL